MKMNRYRFGLQPALWSLALLGTLAGCNPAIVELPGSRNERPASAAETPTGAAPTAPAPCPACALAGKPRPAPESSEALAWVDPAAANADPPTAGSSSATAKPTADGVTLKGRVILDGPPPQRREVKMSKDRDCVKLHGDKTALDESLLVADGGGVCNAFVYIRRGAPKSDRPPPSEPALLTQENCMFRPRVQGMLVGQSLRVLNEDPLTHNVRSIPVRNKAFNFGQPGNSEARERVFTQPEREIEIQCDIHPWMHAYLFVMDHPYFAVSDAEGGFAIERLPPGKYSLAVWHEALGKQDRELTIASEPPAEVEFRFPSPTSR